MKTHIDEKVVPIKLTNEIDYTMSLDTGYYILGSLEKFVIEEIFNQSISVYIPSSFIDMPDEIKAIKYPTNFRPEIIKTNLVGDINLSFSFFEDNEDVDIETLVKDFKNLLSKTHKGVKFLDSTKLKKEGYIEMHCFDFILPGIDEKIYHMIGMGKAGRKIIQIIFNCSESSANAWKKAVTDIFQTIELIRK